MSSSTRQAPPVMQEEDLLNLLHDDMVIYINGGTGLPNRFFELLSKNAHRFKNIRFCHPMRREAQPLSPEITAKELEGHIYHVSDFAYDKPVIDAVRDGRATYRPVHPHLSGSNFSYDIDLIVTAAAPMDKHGFFSLGAFGGWIDDFLYKGKKLVLEVNPQQPRLHGHCLVHARDVAATYEADYPLVTIAMSGEVASEEEKAMGRHIAGVIEDGATIQVGAGKVPDAVIKQLVNGGQQDLGVHSEALFDWVVELWDAGLITNRKKTLHPGKIICCCAVGTTRLYDFMDDNPALEMHPISYTNDVGIIQQNHKQVSINATIQMDLFGQCASETLGPRHYSGVGGQWAFHYGASVAPGGIGIMTLPATAKNGTVSRINPLLPEGSVVTISRNDIHYVCTEFGIENLRGLTLAERAVKLIGLAHPKFREELMRAARDDLRLVPRHFHPAGSVVSAAQ